MEYDKSTDSYNDPESAKNHLEFLGSQDGQFFQQVLFETFADRLNENHDQKILDAACGPGWLSAKLNHKYKNIEGVDNSEAFLDIARTTYPDIKFTKGDLNSTLPYSDNEFETIIFSMAAHDVEDQIHTFTELRRILKPDGKLMISIANPYYAYPIGTWKRTFLGKLFFWKPKLLVEPYHLRAHQNRAFTFNKTIQSYFVKLSEHLNNLKTAGFRFEYLSELESQQDSNEFNFQYKLHRYPILLYIEVKK